MGLVYEARHVVLGRSFALKLLGPSVSAHAEFGKRFRVEAAALGRLKHPNVVDVTDFGVDPRDSGVPYLVMEFLRGSSLADRIRNRGPLDLPEALPIFRSIARAVDFAHQRGVLHRDLKPANVFLVAHALPDQAVKVLDFGVSKLFGSDDEASPDAPTQAGAGTASNDHPASRTQTGMILGSVAYMAPEISRAEAATPASDIYSFGTLIYECLVGRTPFDGTAEEVLVSHSRDVPRAPSARLASLSAELDDALLAPLDKVPENRPRTAARVVERIEAAAHRISLAEWRRREVPRRFRVSLALGVAVTAASALLARSVPLTRFEARTVDARFRATATRPPDPRLLLIAVDDASLEADPTPLSQKADEVGRGLEEVFRAGALAVGVDLLLPEAWSHSSRFSDVVLRRADRLTLAALSTPDGGIVGPEVIQGLTTAAMGPRRAGDLFGLVNVGPDPDRVVRRARRFYRDSSGAERLTWAARVAATVGRQAPAEASESFRVDYAADPTRLRRVSWKDLPSTLEQDPGLFANRIVLVGAEFSGGGDEMHPVPAKAGAPGSVSGLVLQALIVNTLLEGPPFRDAPRLPVGLLFATLGGALAFGILASGRPMLVGVAGFLLLAAYAAAALLYFERGIVLPAAEPLLIVVLTMAAAVTIRRRLLRPFAEVSA
jgi:serine/threonine-protein kinase